MKRLHLSSRRVFWVLAALTLLVSHDAVWLVQMGPGEGLATALRTGGHDLWGAASAVILVAAVVAAVAVGIRLAGLGRRALAVGAPIAVRPRPYAGRVWATWLRLAAVVFLAFALQENAEHFIAHGHVLGAGALIGPEYPLAIPVIGIIALVAAAVAAAVVTVETEIRAGIAAALAASSPTRAPRRIGRPSRGATVRRLPALAGTDAGRAPPLLPVIG